MLAVGLSPALGAQVGPAESPPALVQLADEFYAWLDANRPVSRFAPVRSPRPEGWVPEWTGNALQRRKMKYLQFQGRLKAINVLGFETGARIDAAILGAAMERVHWQLEVLASASRDPGFYLDQSLGSIFELLIQAPEPTEEEIEELVRRLRQFPTLINSAKLELNRAVRVLAEAAIARIGDVDARITALEAALRPYVPERLESKFAVGIRAARQSLTSYKDWLSLSLERFNESPAIGAQRYRWYLGHVVMVPRSPDALLIETELALARTGAQLAVTRQRFTELPSPTAFGNVSRLVQMAEISRQELGAFLTSANLVPVSEDMANFAVTALPPALAPISDVGELIDFGPGDGETSLRYIPAARGESTYLERAAWLDPRLLIAWDGVPGRHAQFWAAAHHPRLLRRRATGVTLSDALALYMHEQVMESGLYSFKPASALLALELLRHRAALAHTDLRLAMGEASVEEAVDFLVQQAGLSRAQALSETQQLVAFPAMAGAAFAAYAQVVRFLADAAGAKGEEFVLSEFNDRLLRNAHVPIALQRWEYLGQEDELDQLTELRGRPATVPQ